jgi:hypothetical protein
MIQCNELAGKTVRQLTLYEDASCGPEVHIEFTDGTIFSANLKTSLEAKCLRDEGGEPTVLHDYTPGTLR